MVMMMFRSEEADNVVCNEDQRNKWKMSTNCITEKLDYLIVHLGMTIVGR